MEFSELGSYGYFPKIVGFPPKSSILIGFSTISTIHFGGKIPLFWETPTHIKSATTNSPTSVGGSWHLAFLTEVPDSQKQGEQQTHKKTFLDWWFFTNPFQQNMLVKLETFPPIFGVNIQKIFRHRFFHNIFILTPFISTKAFRCKIGSISPSTKHHSE